MKLVCIVDISGSMSGSKLALMKDALTFVVSKGLQASDALEIVTFETAIAVELPFIMTDARGKKHAELTAVAVGGVALISRVLSNGYKFELSPDGSSAIILLGNLYAEDEKDILVELLLPMLPRELAVASPALVWTVRYYDCLEQTFQTEAADVSNERPEAVPGATPFPRPSRFTACDFWRRRQLRMLRMSPTPATLRRVRPSFSRRCRCVARRPWRAPPPRCQSLRDLIYGQTRASCRTLLSQLLLLPIQNP
ncbi:hypothetical protein T492DRAFT_397592 [Pavlovales sp. CCMP2436]|nr:hypothetical protein T492DRAFT_397592 [Pavlovales sp. CCMP2436]